MQTGRSLYLALTLPRLKNFAVLGHSRQLDMDVDRYIISLQGYLYKLIYLFTRLIELLQKDTLISEVEVRDLCFLARDILIDESNIQKIATPITVSPILY